MGRTQALIVAAAAILVLSEVAVAQGLGDASKKEKARREQTKAPKAKPAGRRAGALLCRGGSC
jgi:hypothetical protein